MTKEDRSKEYKSRPEVKERIKQWYLNNRDSVRKKSYERYHSNREDILEQTKEYRSRPEVKEQRKEHNREYNQRPEIRDRNKQWIIDNKEHLKKYQKEYNLEYLYGITQEQHKQMFISQDGKCAICNKLFDNSKDVCVDHNHNTDQVRQLLCGKCNKAIGFFNDDITIVEKSLEYLKKWKPKLDKR